MLNSGLRKIAVAALAVLLMLTSVLSVSAVDTSAKGADQDAKVSGESAGTAGDADDEDGIEYGGDELGDLEEDELYWEESDEGSGIEDDASGAETASSVSISDYSKPDYIAAGHGFDVRGILKSKGSKISKVDIGVKTKDGSWTSVRFTARDVGASKYDLINADESLRFGQLKAGDYSYRITVTTEDNVSHSVLRKSFTVMKNGKPEAVDCSYPRQLTKGSPFGISGKIISPSNIKSVTAGVKKAGGKWTSLKYTCSNVNRKTFNMSRADTSLRFGRLAKGSYRYVIIVRNGSGTKTVLNRTFKVVKKSKGGNKGNYSNVITAGDGSVKLFNCNLPGTRKVGKSFSLSGSIKSKETIQKVEIGIINEPTNKWSVYKYTNNNVNAKVFDISRAAAKVRFDKLPGGSFKYRMYVHTKKGVTTVLDYPFTVTPSKKPLKAVKWAVKIANDDSFAYGKKPKTSKVGCYFCGTTKKNKPKGYEKTYVCLTFVHAAYAHGAKDPEMLKECKGGQHCISVSNVNFTKYTCWFKVGLTKDLTVADLQPGDVICYYSPTGYTKGHIAMYAGNNQIVDAQGIKDCWGPNSIAVRNNAATALRHATRHSSNSYVMRYIH